MKEKSDAERLIGLRSDLRFLCLPKQAAQRLRISEERLVELATQGLAPCVFVDNQMFFHGKDLIGWATSNLVRIQHGTKLPIEIKVFENRKAVALGIPDSLLPMADRLRELGNEGLSSCVYFLIKDRQVVYVGQSVNLLSRIGQHRGDSRKQFDKVLYITLPTEALNRVESALISFLKPTLNQVNGRYFPTGNKPTLIELGLATGDEAENCVHSSNEPFDPEAFDYGTAIQQTIAQFQHKIVSEDIV